MKIRNILPFFFVLFFLGCGKQTPPPFDYAANVFSIPGTKERTMMCCHGYGGNHTIAQKVKDWGAIEATLLSFNFPDHDIKETDQRDYTQTAFGTLDELLPAFHILKKVVVDQGLSSIDLYGFSAGGGAVVNIIAILNSSAYDAKLREIGISKREKKLLLAAIQKGLVILEVPLKSVEEIIDSMGSRKDLEIVAKKYRQSGLRPIDSINLLKGLSLNILLYFEEKDEVLSNRDDALYIERLQKANSRGTTSVVIGTGGGHSKQHPALWSLYTQITSKFGF